MTITEIKALHMVDPARARKEILEQLEKCLGNAELAAKQFDCNYRTILRIIQSDPILDKAVLKLRKKLESQGVGQRGHGDWHRSR